MVHIVVTDRIPNNKREQERFIAEKFLLHAGYSISGQVRSSNPPCSDVEVEVLLQEENTPKVAGIELTQIMVPAGQNNFRRYKPEQVAQEASKKIKRNAMTGAIAINVVCRNAYTDDCKVPNPTDLANAINKFIESDLNQEFFEIYGSRNPYFLKPSASLERSVEWISIIPGRALPGNPNIRHSSQPNLNIQAGISYGPSDIYELSKRTVLNKNSKSYASSVDENEKWLLLWTFGENFLQTDNQNCVIAGILSAALSIQAPIFSNLIYYHHSRDWARYVELKLR